MQVLFRSQCGFVKRKHGKFKLHIQSASIQLTRVHLDSGRLRDGHWGRFVTRRAARAKRVTRGMASLVSQDIYLSFDIGI